MSQVGAFVRGGGDVVSLSASPPAAPSLSGMLLATVDPFDVELGYDVLESVAGRRVQSVRLCRAGWVFFDAVGDTIDIVPVGALVRVIRPESDVDDCSPWGILRPPLTLELAR